MDSFSRRRPPKFQNGPDFGKIMSSLWNDDDMTTCPVFDDHWQCESPLNSSATTYSPYSWSIASSPWTPSPLDKFRSDYPDTDNEFAFPSPSLNKSHFYGAFTQEDVQQDVEFAYPNEYGQEQYLRHEMTDCIPPSDTDFTNIPMGRAITKPSLRLPIALSPLSMAWNPLRKPETCFEELKIDCADNYDTQVLNHGGDGRDYDQVRSAREELLMDSSDNLIERYRHFKVKPNLSMIDEKRLGKTSRARQRKPTVTECVFCKNNGEIDTVYRNHVLKDPFGNIICPVLRYYDCPICKNGGGDQAHTVRYCPRNRPSWKEKMLKATRES